MAPTTDRFILERLADEWGVERVCGYLGDGIGGQIERPEDVGPARDEVLAAGRPAVLDVVTDPEVPPLPPHIRLDQAIAMAKALRRGEPATKEIVRNAVKGKLAEFLGR